MNKLRNIFLVGVLLLLGNTAFAAPVFFSWGGDSFYKVADLPDTYEYQINSDFIDIGVKYSEVQIMFLPIWQYDIKYIGFIPNDESYYDLGNEEVMQLAAYASISIPPVSQIKFDFWTAWGGKIVLILLIALYGMYILHSAKEDAVDN